MEPTSRGEHIPSNPEDSKEEREEDTEISDIVAKILAHLKETKQRPELMRHKEYEIRKKGEIHSESSVVSQGSKHLLKETSQRMEDFAQTSPAGKSNKSESVLIEVKHIEEMIKKDVSSEETGTYFRNETPGIVALRSYIDENCLGWLDKVFFNGKMRSELRHILLEYDKRPDKKERRTKDLYGKQLLPFFLTSFQKNLESIDPGLQRMLKTLDKETSKKFDNQNTELKTFVLVSLRVLLPYWVQQTLKKYPHEEAMESIGVISGMFEEIKKMNNLPNELQGLFSEKRLSEE